MNHKNTKIKTNIEERINQNTGDLTWTTINTTGPQVETHQSNIERENSHSRFTNVHKTMNERLDERRRTRSTSPRKRSPPTRHAKRHCTSSPKKLETTGQTSLALPSDCRWGKSSISKFRIAIRPFVSELQNRLKPNGFRAALRRYHDVTTG